MNKNFNLTRKKMLSFNGKQLTFHSICVLQIVCVCILISTCLADVFFDPIYKDPFYKGPIYKDFYKGPFYKGIYKEPFYKGIYKGPYYKGFYKGPYYKGFYKGPIYDYADDEYPGEIPCDGDKLIDYWNTFKEIFLQSYADITKPYVVEKPVPVPVPVDRVRTVVKSYPVFIKPKPSVVVIRRFKHH